ncbi:MAG: SEC-C metal-binding domain-containing protein, partial [Dehalococcoidales bacterium]|nr:SEC-C metal-binding domain-containing protein [Dehalococcoidales bacterium]
YHTSVTRKEAPQQISSPMAQLAAVKTDVGKKQQAKILGKKVGRNDPCSCGSGKKFKKCCGK